MRDANASFRVHLAHEGLGVAQRDLREIAQAGERRRADLACDSEGHPDAAGNVAEIFRVDGWRCRGHPAGPFRAAVIVDEGGGRVAADDARRARRQVAVAEVVAHLGHDVEVDAEGREHGGGVGGCAAEREPDAAVLGDDGVVAVVADQQEFARREHGRWRSRRMSYFRATSARRTALGRPPSGRNGA